MISEAGHYTTFIGFARKYGTGVDVESRWQAYLDYEASIMANYSKKETMHG
jgi:tRNA-(ms[2]io[6]A)-hydroxylase